MTAVPHHARYSLDEYLRLEAYSNVKHEFLDGEIYAMTGGTPEHAATSVRVSASLLSQLRGRRCTVYSSDLRVRVAGSGLYTYADVTVVCGTEQRDRADQNAIVNPVVIVEVLSPGTEAYDRGDKLQHYKLIPSLQEVVLIAHDDPRIDVVRREGAAWISVTSRRGDVARLASIGCTLAVDDLFLEPQAP